MALAQEDLQQIGEYVKSNIGDWIAEQSLGKPPVVYEIELRERMVRVEEELKHQRELMREGFNQIDRRLELMQANMDRRFELMQDEMDKRFDQVDKRFEQVDKRFESVQQDIRALQQRMDSFMRWSFGVTIGTGGLIIGVLKLWPSPGG
jgi:ABC-type phosphate transport system auxiliary subunit